MLPARVVGVENGCLFIFAIFTVHFCFSFLFSDNLVFICILHHSVRDKGRNVEGGENLMESGKWKVENGKRKAGGIDAR